MGKINLLNSALSNMIAAGEVVERPSSVVKELLENALDAHATQIDIIIKEAGRMLIEVIDNGIGMDHNDALMAFKRHATSKIKSELDLQKIETLGFRGEALPSIAAVSEVEIITSQGDVGTRVIIKASEIILDEPSSARRGTTIKVRELFYNTPARLKHLKSDNTELASIVEVVSHLALGYPSVKFNLISDDKPIFTSNGNNNILEVIAKTYGVDTARNMVKVEFEDYDFKITGYTSKIQVTRANRYSIVTLLNGRYVRINSVVNAMCEAYNTYIPSDRYPLSVLNIEVDPFLVDINVHPSKQIVRLSKEHELSSLIKSQISAALRNELMIPNIEKKKIPIEEKIQPTLDFDALSFLTPSETKRTLNEEIEPYVAKHQEVDNSIPNKLEDEQKNIEVNHNIPFYLRVIGQHHGTYIVCETDEGLILVDQHAAAERINFDKYSDLLGTNDACVSLLIPLIIDLSSREINEILEKNELLQSLGIMVEHFGPTSLRISEVPNYMVDVDLQIYASELFELLLKNINVSQSLIRQHAIATIACKASIKANHSLTQEDMEQLIGKLFTCENPHTCPHGRPTMIKYTNYELEKYFKRS